MSSSVALLLNMSRCYGAYSLGLALGVSRRDLVHVYAVERAPLKLSASETRYGTYNIEMEGSSCEEPSMALSSVAS